jgi:uncharacterized protein
MSEFKIDLKQVFEKEKQPFYKKTYKFTAEDLNLPADVGEIKEPIEVEIYITKNPSGEGYTVSYNIKGAVELLCARCLNAFDKDISGSHTVKLKNSYAGDRENLKISDLSYHTLSEDNTLDVAELIREQIILDVPYKPLCHPHCKGIDYTKEEPHAQPNPFEALKKLLK